MLRIAPRYIILEILSNFFTGLLVFSFILIISKLFQLMQMIFEYDFNIIIVIKLCILVLPDFLVFTIPMSLLFSIILTFGRLSSEYEIVALKASGVSLFQIIRPIILFTLLCYLSSAYLTFYVAPRRNFNFQKTVVHNLNSNLKLLIKEKRFTSLKDMVIYVDRIPSHSNKLYGILVYDNTNMDEPLTLVAREGILLSDEYNMSFTLRLKNAFMLFKSIETNSNKTLQFDEYDLEIVPFTKYDDIRHFTVHQNYYEMTLNELYPKLNELRGTLNSLMEIREIDSVGEEALKRNELAIEYYISQIRRCKVEISKRYAIPFACIVFMLLGIPLGIQLELRRGLSSFVAALIVFFLYYILMTLGEKMGKYGQIDPFFSFWFANIVFFGIGLYMLIQTGRETHLKIFTIYRNLRRPDSALAQALKRLTTKR